MPPKKSVPKPITLNSEQQITCRSCGLTKPRESFYNHGRGKSGKRPDCIECVRKASEEKRKEITSKKCSLCKDTKSVDQFSKNCWHVDGLASYCKSCQAEYSKPRRASYKPRKNESARKTRADLRLEVLQHYSEAFPFCACCGENHPEFLSIDHINGGGSKHKKQVRHVYKWLKDNGFPEGFRVLCHNCNQSRGAYGYCPHEKERDHTPEAS